MREQIDVVFQSTVPDEIIGEFPVTALTEAFKAPIVLKKDGDEPANFAGNLIAEAVLFIRGHQAELLTTGFLFPMAYDLLKASVMRLWVRLYMKDAQPTSKHTNYVSIRIEHKDREIDLVFQGSPDQIDLDKIIDKAFAFLSTAEIETAFNNKDYIEIPAKKPRIRIVFDENTRLWTTLNFTDCEKIINDISESAEKYFDS